MPQSSPPAEPSHSTAAAHAPRPVGSARKWSWFVAKNVIGWLLILASWPVGLTLPGLGGIPLFLIGFGLITFPGKRRLTARVLRGKPIDSKATSFRRGVAITALLLPGVAIIWVGISFHWSYQFAMRHGLMFGAIYFATAVLMWIIGLNSVVAMNWAFRMVAQGRRRGRPWLRRHGLTLLPRRRRRKLAGDHDDMGDDQEIVEIAERHRRRVRTAWSFGKVWLRRAIGLGITVAIFVWICRPIVRHWEQVKDGLWETSWGWLILASLMFSIFLFVFRSLSWRRILIGFGHRIPVSASTRIWSTSELARYLPGAIWQVVGRMYLVRPYGVSGSVCSASQVLELVIFLLANILLAVGCLTWLGIKTFHGLPRMWLFAVMGLIPVLIFLMHPKVFYPLLNRVMRRLGKEPVARRMRFRELCGLLLWAVLGLVWQSLAIWLVVHQPPFKLQFTKWWVVAGAYSLAWCAGFLAVWAPGGIGVREAVFVAAMELSLPAPVRARLADPGLRLGFLALLSVLLRLWATAGELILATLAYIFDFRGALGRPDAPGRVRPEERAKPVVSCATE